MNMKYEYEILGLSKENLSILIDDWMVVDFDIDGEFEIVDDSFAHEFGIEKSFYFEDNTELSVSGVYDYETEQPINVKITKSMMSEIHEVMYEDMCKVYESEMCDRFYD